jgi:hypothetical protein
VSALPCGHDDWFAVQYGHDAPRWAWYDGMSEMVCQSCGKRYGRWSLRELAVGEYEPRYGGGTVAFNPGGAL